MKTIEGNFDNLEVNRLLKKHFIELRSVSSEGSTHVLDIEGLQDKSIKFWSIYENDKLIGCGALKFLDPKHGELKSIRVADHFRNKDYGKKIIKVLIKKSQQLNIKKISIETGSGKFFLPARKLFINTGFTACKPFGHYVDDPNSCYMSLEL